jgi:hypothetical protein
MFCHSTQGPYYSGHKNSPDDPYTDTLPRVIKGLEMFKELYGAPTMVYYRAELWDIHVTYNFTENLHLSIIEQFVNDTGTVFTALQNQLPATTLLATHTVPITTWGGPLHLRYTSALRYIAMTSKFLLVDWQHLVVDSSLKDYLRDRHHPKPRLCAAIGQFMINIANKYLHDIETCGKS